MVSHSERGKRILIIEDGAVIREAMRMILEWEDYQVDCATNGLEALQHLHQSALPDLILLDLAMPVLDGYQFLQELEQEPALAAIPVIDVSASEETTYPPAAGHLRKPFQPQELLEIIRNLGRGQPTQTTIPSDGRLEGPA